MVINDPCWKVGLRLVLYGARLLSGSHKCASTSYDLSWISVSCSLGLTVTLLSSKPPLILTVMFCFLDPQGILLFIQYEDKIMRVK